MKRLLLLLCLSAVLQVQQGYGQDSSSKVSFLFSPALLVPSTAAAQGGVQLRLGKRWSLLAEGAFPVFHPQNTDYEKVSYWRTGLEVKHYLSMQKTVRYISLQNNFLFRELENGDGVYYSRTQTFAYTNAVIKSPVLSSAIKLGLEVPLGRRIYFDLFTGAGLRWIFNKYKTETALVTSIQPNKQDFFKYDDAWAYNYTLTRIHLTAGLRFGIRL